MPDSEKPFMLLPSGLDKVVDAIYEAGRPKYDQGKKIPGETSFEELKSLIPQPPEAAENILRSALILLKTMGLISIDNNGNVRATSRYAHFALGSLSKFLSSSVSVADEPVAEDEERVLISLTQALETARRDKKSLFRSEDQSYLHHRRIVNVIVKGRQLRKGVETDVYLHVYHPDWREYHLVGLSHKDDTKSDDELAQLALEKQVGLKPSEYVIDPLLNPKEVEIPPLISRTSGVLTKYTFCVRVLKEVSVPLKLREWMETGKFPLGWFRWFTWEEIRQRESYQGEPIMFSTPEVMKEIDLSSLPVSAAKAEDARRRIGIRDELGRRFSIRQWVTVAILIFISAITFFVLRLIAPPGSPNAMLEDYANLATILTFLGSLVYALCAIIRGARR